ncbi:MAG: AbrB/MazE/SpoVT family DNA-binding domain-containing protein [Halarsenatibacteraceae bacterium]
MTEKIPVKLDSRGRITIPKKAREEAEIEEGDILFMSLEPGKIEFTRAIEDPIVVLRDYSEKEFEKGKTRDLRDYAKEKEIEIDE